MDSLTLKRHSKATNRFALRTLIFKLQQKVLKLSDIGVR